MPRIPKPFHKPARRESIATVSVDEEVRHICLDDTSQRSFQRAEEDVVNNADIGITFAEGADVALYSVNQQSCQCSSGSGARGRRQIRAAAGILSE
jgi:hypothetical protein